MQAPNTRRGRGACLGAAQHGQGGLGGGLHGVPSRLGRLRGARRLHGRLLRRLHRLQEAFNLFKPPVTALPHIL